MLLRVIFSPLSNSNFFNHVEHVEHVEGLIVSQGDCCGFVVNEHI